VWALSGYFLLFLACCLILIICLLHLPANGARAGWAGAAIGGAAVLSLFGAALFFARFVTTLNPRGQMSPIADSVTALRTTIAAFTPSTVPISDLVTALIGLNDARTVQLDPMESKLDDARDEPWQRGVALLREATVIPEQSRQRLASAAESFELARVAEHSFLAALTAAAIYGKLGNRRKARHFAEQSYWGAFFAAEDESEAANRVSARRRKTIKWVVRVIGWLAAVATVGLVAGLEKRASAVQYTGKFLGPGVLFSAAFLLAWLGLRSEWFAEFALGNLRNSRFANARDLALVVNDIKQIAVALACVFHAGKPTRA
jgi:hypothetical protein